MRLEVHPVCSLCSEHEKMDSVRKASNAKHLLYIMLILKYMSVFEPLILFRWARVPQETNVTQWARELWNALFVKFQEAEAITRTDGQSSKATKAENWSASKNISRKQKEKHLLTSRILCGHSWYKDSSSLRCSSLSFRSCFIVRLGCDRCEGTHKVPLLN